MRIPSGVTDQGFYFVAVDATDYVSRETGLASFTVVRSRNGAADATMTTPTITEIDATAMPGVYFLLCDEDMTLAAGNHSEAMAYHITHAGMAPVTQQIELYRPDVTAGETLTVSSGVGSANATQWGGTAVASANVLIDGAITAAKIASDAITDAKIASGALTAAKFASGAFDAVWSVTTRLLTAGTNIVLAKGTGVTGFNDLSAAQVNAEADQALADYDGPTNTEMVARTLAAASYATAAAQTTAQNDLDLLTGADGAVLATSQPNYAPATAADLATTDGKVDDILTDTGTTLPATLSTIAGYIDTEITTLQTTANNIETDTQDIQTTLAALSIPTANDNADALLDRTNGVETGLTLRGALRLALAALAGKVSGAGTGTEVFRNAVADSKTRITSTVDGDGNRTAVSTDAS